MKKTICILMAVSIALSGTVGCLHAKHTYKKNLEQALAVYDGELKAPALKDKVEVYRDEFAVPHIFAENEHDLYWAVGYTQAQDRLWEMILFRAVAEGRTAELFGDIKIPGASFKGFPINTRIIDQQQRTIGMKHIGESGAALLKEKQPETYNQLQAYSDGVNYFIETHPDYKDLPIEFQLLKTKPQPWSPADVISFSRLMGFILGYNMMVELLRTGLMAKYDEDLAWAVAPVHDSYGPTIVPPELLENKLDKKREGLPPGGKPSLEELGGPPILSADAAFKLLHTTKFVSNIVGGDLPFASNNWVLSPKMTTTGTAMLANDTHMPHMEPSIWYMAHLKCPTMDVSGVMFSGIPYIPLGHTKDLAWSATTSIADVQDLFVETVSEDGTKYLHDGEWKPFTVRTEKYCVRQIPTNKCKWEEVEIRQTVHGPIMSDFLPLPEGTPPVALRWTAWDFSRDQSMFDALVQSTDADDFIGKVRKMDEIELCSIAQAMDTLMKGKSVDDFIKAMGQVDLPSQNWMAADSAGNIAYLPGGLVPIRGKGLGAIPVPGESGDYDWTGFIPLMELPHVINPDRGWMVSANNEVVDAEWYPYVFDLNYDGGFRAWRVQELIEELKPIDMADMKRIQNDTVATKARVEVPLILKAIEDKNVTDPQVLKAYKLLKEWDYDADLDSPGCTIFFKYAHSMRAAMFKDEVSAEDFETYLSASHIEIAIELIIKHGESPIWDDKNTPDKVEDMEDIMVIAIKDAMEFIEGRYGEDPSDWECGDVHVIKWFHPLGFGPLKDLSIGPFPHVGSRHTIRNASPADEGRWHFKAMYGPAWRHLIDMGDVENAQGVIDGSISGQWLSPHYKDMHMVWLKGDHLTMTMDTDNVKAQAKYHLTMNP